MKEDFLYYIWQQQYFDKTNLCTAEQEKIQVLKPGFLNANAGPDFMAAQLKIGQVTWNGSIEIHLKASDWLRHRHQEDTRYDQVILHVVWENDQTLTRTDGSLIPVIQLKDRVDLNLLSTYHKLKNQPHLIPCAPFVPQVPTLPKLQMLDRVLLERLDEKTNVLTQQLQQVKYDWEEATYQALVANFGFKINKEPFIRLSQILPFSVLRKHREEQTTLEALLFGQAGFLQEVPETEPYLLKLAKEHAYLQHKYKLPEPLQAADWNFLRLRPGNFPTVRLAQLAAFLHGKSQLFSALINLPGYKDYLHFFSVAVSAYWQKHYMPGRVWPRENKCMGKDSIDILLINTVVPLLFTYARYSDSQSLHDKALKLLEDIKAEKNNITAIYTGLGFKNKSAQDSQAFLQLYHHYCTPRRCASCSIGHFILKSNCTTA